MSQLGHFCHLRDVVMTEGDPNDQTKTNMAPGFRKGQEESLGTASFAFVGENVMERLRLDRA